VKFVTAGQLIGSSCLLFCDGTTIFAQNTGQTTMGID